MICAFCIYTVDPKEAWKTAITIIDGNACCHKHAKYMQAGGFEVRLHFVLEDDKKAAEHAEAFKKAVSQDG